MSVNNVNSNMYQVLKSAGYNIPSLKNNVTQPKVSLENSSDEVLISNKNVKNNNRNKKLLKAAILSGAVATMAILLGVVLNKNKAKAIQKTEQHIATTANELKDEGVAIYNKMKQMAKDATSKTKKTSDGSLINVVFETDEKTKTTRQYSFLNGVIDNIEETCGKKKNKYCFSKGKPLSYEENIQKLADGTIQTDKKVSYIGKEMIYNKGYSESPKGASQSAYRILCIDNRINRFDEALVSDGKSCELSKYSSVFLDDNPAAIFQDCKTTTGDSKIEAKKYYERVAGVMERVKDKSAH